MAKSMSEKKFLVLSSNAENTKIGRLWERLEKLYTFF